MQWIHLSILDSLLALFVFFPFTIFYWRGVWDLLGYYFLRSNKIRGIWILVGIGLSVTYLLYFIFAYVVDKKLKSISSKWLNIIITRLCLVIYGFFFMFMWRGLWEMFNHYIGKDLKEGAISFAVGVILISTIRCTKTLMWPPMNIAVDFREDVIRPCCRFSTNPKHKIRYLFDAFFTQIFIQPLAIFCWRSGFNVLDKTIYESNKFKSDIVSLIVGVSGCSLLIFLQYPLSRLSIQLEKNKVLKILYEDFIHVIALVPLLFFYRGFWNLNEEYIIKDKKVGGWINHAIGLSMLLLFQTLSTLVGPGCIVDGKEPHGEAIFSIKYTRAMESLKVMFRLIFPRL